MKPWILLTCAVFGALYMPLSDAQTIEWGAADGKTLIDSDGDGIDDNFVFELGAFALDFDPKESNVGQWLTHWKVFDRLIYDSVFGYNASSSNILANGTSDYPFASDPDFNFFGLDAYIWIRKGEEPVPGSEWFLARSEIWNFPVPLAEGGCCNPDFSEWSSSDMTASDVPVWGWQNESLTPTGTEANGVYTDRGFDARSIVGPETTRTPAMQTLTFIPEPSSSLLVMLGAAGLVLTRRRHLVAR